MVVFKIVRNILSSTENKNDNSYKETLSYTIILFSSFVITMIIMSLLGKMLWNNYLTEVIPSINKIDSVFQLLAIYLLTQMFLS